MRIDFYLYKEYKKIMVENKSSVKTDNFLKYSIAITLLIGALSLAYYFVIFLPQKNNLQMEQARQEEAYDFQKDTVESYNQISTEQKVQDCLNEVSKRGTDVANEMKGKEISTEELKLVADILQKQRDECIKKYSSK